MMKYFIWVFRPRSSIQLFRNAGSQPVSLMVLLRYTRNYMRERKCKPR